MMNKNALKKIRKGWNNAGSGSPVTPMQWVGSLTVAPEIVCIKNGRPGSICQPMQAKTMIGIKFYCHVCKRYVLEDKNHKVIRLRT